MWRMDGARVHHGNRARAAPGPWSSNESQRRTPTASTCGRSGTTRSRLDLAQAAVGDRGSMRWLRMGIRSDRSAPVDEAAGATRRGGLVRKSLVPVLLRPLVVEYCSEQSMAIDFLGQGQLARHRFLLLAGCGTGYLGSLGDTGQHLVLHHSPPSTSAAHKRTTPVPLWCPERIPDGPGRTPNPPPTQTLLI